MKVLRTPEERFAGLPGFGYAPRYADVDGLRLAYVETGPADGEPVLLLHGEPSWWRRRRPGRRRFYRAGPVPTTPDDPASAANRAAWGRLAAWDKPFLVAFSDRDPITASMAPVLKDTVPGAAGLEHPVIAGAGHFLQEDAGERLGAVIAGFVRAHPAR
jgi:pimeloyl-ACP methyl ester carboxylesterase